MAGFYVPSNFSANYVANKKNEDNTYVYDSARNRAGIDAQRNMQQLNKQYNVTLNSAYAQNLLANRGLQASALGTGYKEAFAQDLQASTNEQITQASLSVGDAKQNIFSSLASQLEQIGGVQKQEIDNMRRVAGSLEQYYDYVKGLQKEGTPYTETYGFNEGDFEANYEKLFQANKGSVEGYLDLESNPALAYEDWLRQKSGTSEADTAWLDWVYGGGLNQYKDFVQPKIKADKQAAEQAIKQAAEQQAAEEAAKKTPPTTLTPDQASKKALWELFNVFGK